MKKLRLAVVGCGAYESSRARGYIATMVKLTDLYDLCAICDHSEQSLQVVGERFGIDARYTDFEAMLDGESPDVVFILVPTDGQAVMALTAIERGCHIITEIPYAHTLAIGDAIDRACRERGVVWEVAENVWLWPQEQLKQKIVREGLLGKLTHARLWYTSGSYHGINGVRMILDKAATRALGYAQSVEVLPYSNYGGVEETSRWWESAVVEFEDDVVCLYEMSPAGARGNFWDIEGVEGHLSGHELVLYGGGERASYPIRETFEEIDGEQVLSAVRVDTDPPVVWENPFKYQKVSHTDDVAKAAILDSLHRAVTEGAEPQYSPANARRDLEIWIAIRESANRGSVWVDLPLMEQTDLERRFEAEYVRQYGGHPITDRKRLLNAPFQRLSPLWTVAGWL